MKSEKPKGFMPTQIAIFAIMVAVFIFVVWSFVAKQSTTVQQVRQHILTDEPQAAFCRAISKTSLYDRTMQKACESSGVNVVMLFNAALDAFEKVQQCEGGNGK